MGHAQPPSPINVAIIGLGFMGTTHLRAYQAAAEAGFACRVVAVCDARENRRNGIADDIGGNMGGAATQRLFDPRLVRGSADAGEIFADDRVHLVSICTQTETHVELASRAMRAGKHVLLEKPVALTADETRKVAEVSQATGTLCMPAMCMRFWPAWSWLKRAIDEKPYGQCRSLSLQRLGGAPGWAQDFYLNPSRSGGAIVDLHVHDADFVRYCFGNPAAVTSTGYKTGGAINNVLTRYHFESPLQVVAEGGWYSDGFTFRMRYVAHFEQATADFDIGRDPQLLLARDGKSTAVELDSLAGYDHEIRHFLEVITHRKSALVASIHDAVDTMRLLEAEIASVNSGATVRL